MYKKILLIFLLSIIVITPIKVLALDENGLSTGRDNLLDLHQKVSPSQAALMDNEDGSSRGKTALYSMLGKVINTSLSFLGIIFTLIILYAGFLIFTARDNVETVATAKSWLVNAVVGLIIIVLAYAISTFVLSSMQLSTEPTPYDAGPENSY